VLDRVLQNNEDLKKLSESLGVKPEAEGN
jgi:hypothetical protein